MKYLITYADGRQETHRQSSLETQEQFQRFIDEQLEHAPEGTLLTMESL